MQLLSIQTLRCTVVLELPTKAAARLLLAQARREQWHLLVHVVESTDCTEILGRLPSNTALAVLRHPGALSADAVSVLASLPAVTGLPSKGAALQTDIAFVGRAGDYAAWSRVQAPFTIETSAAALRPLLSMNPEYFDAPPTDAHISQRQERRAVGPAKIRLAQSRIDLPSIGKGDVLTIEDHSTSTPEIILCQNCDLFPPGREMKVRMPPGTMNARQLRLRCAKADGPVEATDFLFHVPPSQLRPWMISAFLNRGGAGNPVIRAFANGVNCRIAYAEDEPEVLRDIPVVWGVLRQSDRIVAQAKSQKLHFFYIDHAYFNRGHGKTYRITRDAYEAGPVRNCPSDRFSALGLKIAPWRKSGRDIVVCPPTDHFMQAHGCTDWLERTLAVLRNVTDRPIVVRQKPKSGENITPLPEVLQNAHALVAHSSNVAIEAACLGTPVFVAPTSAAAPVGRMDISKIETPIYPDRTPWLAHLAYNQFSFDEIQDGRAWRMLLELEERDHI
jgi:hypothetical protein